MKTKIFGKILLIVGILILISFVGITCTAQLPEDYAPILYFEGEETCYPVDANYHIDNSDLKMLTMDDGQLAYYDNREGTPDDNGVINHYKSQNYQSIVYYLEGEENGVPFIQYWMFYAFNKGEHNQHEGDWEMVEVVIPSSGEKWVAYSQHYSGQSATWDQVEKEDNHIKVYVARGSHANYLRSYSGKVGISSDIVGSNGKVYRVNEEYILKDITQESWYNGEFLWGEVDSVEDLALGRAGPLGPQYRVDMNGNYMKDGVTWGECVMPANNMLFLLEWFLYNFVLIFAIITAAMLALILFKIYRRHKKYGLGPRIVSMLYIDGFNLKSIGNILCIIAIIIAIFGILNTWYVVSADINVEGVITTEKTDVLSIDGVNGVQITMPSVKGSIPAGAVVFPFYLIILVGLIFMILATIGVHLSRKLGYKYLFRGIRFIGVIAVLLLAIVLLGSFGDSGDGGIGEILNSISSSPMGGNHTLIISESLGENAVNGQANFSWGLGIGAILLLLSGIIFLMAGILEIIDNKTFFKPKIPTEKAKESDREPSAEPKEPPKEEKIPPKKE